MDDLQLSAAPILLAVVLDIKAAAPLSAELLVQRGHDVTIDASEVERIGGQCLQVLLSAKTTWAADGAALRVINPSPEFSDGIDLLGARDLLLQPQTLEQLP